MVIFILLTARADLDDSPSREHYYNVLREFRKAVSSRNIDNAYKADKERARRKFVSVAQLPNPRPYLNPEQYRDFINSYHLHVRNTRVSEIQEYITKCIQKIGYDLNNTLISLFFFNSDNSQFVLPPQNFSAWPKKNLPTDPPNKFDAFITKIRINDCLVFVAFPNCLFLKIKEFHL